MVRVKKRDGRLQRFLESKIIRSVRRAGATARQATYVAVDVSLKIGRKAIIPAAKLSNMVVASLRKVNKKAAQAFVRFRKKKLKIRKKKSR